MADIDRHQLRQLLYRGEVVLIDAQAPGWHDKEHLPGAHAVDWDDIAGSVRAVAPDPDTHLVVYCWNTTCTGSTAVADRLRQHGWTNVDRYPGGEQDWAEAGLPIHSTSNSG
jgi:rhodanese-related sulfurtransferase